MSIWSRIFGRKPSGKKKVARGPIPPASGSIPSRVRDGAGAYIKDTLSIPAKVIDQQLEQFRDLPIDAVEMAHRLTTGGYAMGSNNFFAYVKSTTKIDPTDVELAHLHKELLSQANIIEMQKGNIEAGAKKIKELEAKIQELEDKLASGRTLIME
jgi:hypothetical protein